MIVTCTNNAFTYITRAVIGWKRVLFERIEHRGQPKLSRHLQNCTRCWCYRPSKHPAPLWFSPEINFDQLNSWASKTDHKQNLNCPDVHSPLQIVRLLGWSGARGRVSKLLKKRWYKQKSCRKYIYACVQRVIQEKLMI